MEIKIETKIDKDIFGQDGLYLLKAKLPSGAWVVISEANHPKILSAYKTNILKVFESIK